MMNHNIKADMITVFTLVAGRLLCHPQSMGYDRQFQDIVRIWGPKLKPAQPPSPGTGSA